MSCPPLETNALYLLSVKLIFNSVSYSLAPVHLQSVSLASLVVALNSGGKHLTLTLLSYESAIFATGGKDEFLFHQA